jgi:hypothetical protein
VKVYRRFGGKYFLTPYIAVKVYRRFGGKYFLTPYIAVKVYRRFGGKYFLRPYIAVKVYRRFGGKYFLTPYIAVKVYRRFGGKYILNIQGLRVNQAINQYEACSKQRRSRDYIKTGANYTYYTVHCSESPPTFRMEIFAQYSGIKSKPSNKPVRST